ncbi:MAG: AraC family transcriptional regulator [Betaproteobacteria bacterium]|nr:AraC family transcriptional regulator [Betaproteobacteria bacterium]
MPAAKSTRHHATVAIGFVGGMLSGLSRNHRSPREMLECAGIASQVIKEKAARIPIARFAALYRLVNEQLDDEGFGLFSRPLRPGYFEFMCRSALSAATLDEALQRILRYQNIVMDDFVVKLEKTPDAALLTIIQVQTLAVNQAGRVFAIEWLLRVIHGLATWLVARPVALDQVAFPYPPPVHAAEYELVFAPRCSFDAPQLTARFALEALNLPVRRDDAALRLFLVDAPASITTLYRRERVLSTRVRDALRSALPEHRPLPEIARALFLSPRSLHRRLAEEGTSFQAIKDALRRDLASEWLSKTQRPLSRIAADLGFADASAFYRAFNTWTGEGPRQYRQRAILPAQIEP